MGRGPSFVVVFIFVACGLSSHQGLAIYFSDQGNLTINKNDYPVNTTIHVFTAALEPDESGQIKYSLTASSGQSCTLLSLDPYTGHLSLTPFTLEKAQTESTRSRKNSCGEYRVVAELEGEVGVRNRSKDEVSLTINDTSAFSMSNNVLPSKNEKCSRFSQKTLCFGESMDNLQLSIMENSKSLPLATLVGMNQICNLYTVTYNLESEVLYMNETTSTVWVKGGLDREKVASYDFKLTCLIRGKEGGSEKKFSIPGNLTVLDQNDSPAVLRDAIIEGEVVKIIFGKKNKYVAGERIEEMSHFMVLKDEDLAEGNHFVVNILNDTRGILSLEVTTIESGHSTLCSPVRCSIAYPHLSLTKNVTNNPPWEGDYCVYIEAVDNATRIPQEPVKVLVCLGWGSKTSSPLANLANLDLTPECHNELFDCNNIRTNVSRKAIQPVPLLFPFPKLVVDKTHLLENVSFFLEEIVSFEKDRSQINILYNPKIHSEAESRLKKGEVLPAPAFGVTEKSGIIFLMNSTFLDHTTTTGFNITVKWQWISPSSGPQESNFTFTINLEDGDARKKGLDCEGHHCSQFEEESQCKSACAIGVLNTCLWKMPSSTSNVTEMPDSEIGETMRYSTCTPSPARCPNRVCDELEWEYPSLCPQDCAAEPLGMAKLRKHEHGESYGLSPSNTGVCTCHPTEDTAKCSCGLVVPDTVQSTEKHPGKGRQTTGEPVDTSSRTSYTTVLDNKLEILESANPPCGRGCVIAYSFTSLSVLLIIFIIILIAWRRRSVKKRKSSQSVGGTTDIELSNAFGDRGGNRILLPDLEYGGSGLHSTSHSQSNGLHQNDVASFRVESKWEIPREDLFIDYVLGEGEFGRVLKGLMRSPSGGMVHVAVKMLKGDEIEGNRSVRQEFMAEFSLLKQLDHTNVIKLFGASTSNRAPPLLVMEYAELGSLRSFLRKCRRVEKISHAGDQCEIIGGNRNSNSQVAHPLPQNHRHSSTMNNEVNVSDYIVTPQELLGFSWQIAKGMAYLSDMKMVHRDLAARNVLLTKAKVCKISDFGLTRDIYVDDAYKKKSKDRVPVKWLAPECLTDEVYTSKSDVWSFGVLLFELTTLGASPYPGIQSEILYSLLDSGYRMPQPANCSNEVYSIMERCWQKGPSYRPTFHELVFELSRLLEDGIEYLKLDIPSVSNPGYDIFNPEPETPTTTTTTVPSERSFRRKNSSMENLRLIDYEISTNDDSSLMGRAVFMHTYINEPPSTGVKQEDCTYNLNNNHIVRSKQNSIRDKHNHSSSNDDDQLNSSGYESPITLSTE